MYILGIFVVYLGIGLGLLKTFDVFGIPHFLGKIGAAILLIFGALNVLGYIFPNFPIKFKIPNATHGRLAKLISKATLPATFLMGALVALFEFPCTGGPYLLVLGLLHDGEKFGMGFLYLILYNVIFVLPLIVILLLASDKILMTQAEKWKKHAAGKGKLLGGLAMIILAFVIFLTS
jgi:cytochrome c biogenesis protein CcdA